MQHKPEPTRNLDQARDDLDIHGYCFIADALSETEIATARKRLREQAAAEERQGVSFRDGGSHQRVVDDYGRQRTDAFTEANGGVNQRVWMLANKGRCFRDLITHTLVDELVGHILGEHFIVSNFSANIARPGGVRMGLHSDQWWMPQPVRPGTRGIRPGDITRRASPEYLEPDQSLGIAPAVVVNCMWMLSDFTAENGATEVVPGSHLSGAHPVPGDQSHYPIVSATAPAGTLMVFDGRLWHGTGANTGHTERLGVLSTFCAPQMRQQENQTLGLDRSLWNELDDKLRWRLGFGVWNAYGRIESPAESIVPPEPVRIGELR